MTPVTAPTTAAPPDDPVRAALADPATEAALMARAMSSLNKWLADKPFDIRRQEAKEIIDAASMRALEKAATYDPTRSDVGAWLHGVLANVLREHCRKLRKLPAQPPADVVDWDRMEEPDHHERDLEGIRRRVDRLLERLSPVDRRILEFFYLDNLTHRQIGEQLGIREGTSRQKVRRALAKLDPASYPSDQEEGRS